MLEQQTTAANNQQPAAEVDAFLEELGDLVKDDETKEEFSHTTISTTAPQTSTTPVKSLPPGIAISKLAAGSNSVSSTSAHTTSPSVTSTSAASYQPNPSSVWEIAFDETTNQPYYWNTITDETTWEKPAGLQESHVTQSTVTDAPEVTVSLPPRSDSPVAQHSSDTINSSTSTSDRVVSRSSDSTLTTSQTSSNQIVIKALIAGLQVRLKSLVKPEQE